MEETALGGLMTIMLCVRERDQPIFEKSVKAHSKAESLADLVVTAIDTSEVAKSLMCQPERIIWQSKATGEETPFWSADRPDGNVHAYPFDLPLAMENVARRQMIELGKPNMSVQDFINSWLTAYLYGCRVHQTHCLWYYSPSGDMFPVYTTVFNPSNQRHDSGEYE